MKAEKARAIDVVEAIIEERDKLRRENEALRGRVHALLATQAKLIAEYAQMEELET